MVLFFFFFKQKTAYEMRISDWSSDVCSADLLDQAQAGQTIIVDVTAQDYRSGRSPRAPFGVEAVDRAGDHVRLVYFGRTSGLARKLFPLGEARRVSGRSEEHTSELQSLMRHSYAVFCLKKNKTSLSIIHIYII